MLIPLESNVDFCGKSTWLWKKSTAMHLLSGFLTFLRGTEGELLEAELQMEDLPWGRASGFAAEHGHVTRNFMGVKLVKFDSLTMGDNGVSL